MMVKRIVKRGLQAVGLTITRYNTPNLLKFVPDPADELKWINAAGIRSVLDIGAHSGEMAQQFRSILPDAIIHSFEPLPEPFKKLVNLMGDDARFSASQFALGDKTEHVEMRQHEFTQSSSLLQMSDRHREEFPFTTNSEPVAIEVKRLDDVAERLPLKPNLLVKIDTQGFEDRVIRGGEQTIKKALIVVIEVSFAKLYENQPLFGDIYDQMRSLGFAYGGALHQLCSPRDGQPLQADAIFLKR
jgi:FkbM family methyltransferase